MLLAWCCAFFLSRCCEYTPPRHFTLSHRNTHRFSNPLHNFKTHPGFVTIVKQAQNRARRCKRSVSPRDGVLCDFSLKVSCVILASEPRYISKRKRNQMAEKWHISLPWWRRHCCKQQELTKESSSFLLQVLEISPKFHKWHCALITKMCTTFAYLWTVLVTQGESLVVSSATSSEQDDLDETINFCHGSCTHNSRLFIEFLQQRLGQKCFLRRCIFPFPWLHQQMFSVHGKENNRNCRRSRGSWTWKLTTRMNSSRNARIEVNFGKDHGDKL